MTVPTELIAGDTWAWTSDLTDYPADSWTGVWYFEKENANFTVDSVADGTTHTGRVPAVTSATYDPGKYRVQFVVTSGAIRNTVESGWLEVQPDPALAVNVDHRSTAKIVLAYIETYLADPDNLTASSYSLSGRSLSRWSRSELLAERDKWRAEVRAEVSAQNLAAGKGSPRRLYARFGQR